MVSILKPWASSTYSKQDLPNQHKQRMRDKRTQNVHLWEIQASWWTKGQARLQTKAKSYSLSPWIISNALQQLICNTSLFSRMRLIILNFNLTQHFKDYFYYGFESVLSLEVGIWPLCQEIEQSAGKFFQRPDQVLNYKRLFALEIPDCKEARKLNGPCLII